MAGLCGLPPGVNGGRYPAPVAAPAATPPPQPQRKFVPSGPSTARFFAEACGYAARCGSNKLGTEHVLAAAVFTIQEESARALGAALHMQLSDLLKKSSLEPLPAGQTPSGGEGLPLDPQAEKLLSILDGAGPPALFGALQKLPNQAAATQLLEMARVFAQRAPAPAPQPPQPEGSPAAEPTPAAAPAAVEAGAGGDAGAGAAAGGVAGASAPAANVGGARLLTRSRCYAAFNNNNKVGTEHVLAAAVELFPEAAQNSLSPPVYKQMVQLLEKSQLEIPPADAPTGEGLAVEEDAAELCELPVDGEGGPAKLFEELNDLGDNTAAIQLIEMAKIFADRA